MFTLGGAQGHWRQALRARPLAPVAVLGVLVIALAGSVARTSPHIQLTGYGTSGPAPAHAKSTSPPISQAVTTNAFGIAGRVTGLFPGFSDPLVLKVTNREGFPIIVTSIATTVKNAKANCAAANLSVSAFSGQLSVPAHGSAKTTVRAHMAVSAPEGCIASTFPLVYSGIGRKG